MFWERAFILWHVLVAISLVATGLTGIMLLSVVGKVLRKVKSRYNVLITDEGPAMHAPMPEFEGFTPEDQPVRSRDFAGREFVLLLLSPECAPCQTVLRAVEAVRRASVEPPEFVVVIECSTHRARQDARRFRLRAFVIADPEGAIRSQLDVRRTPYGFLVDPGAIVRMKGVLNHRDHLEALVSRRGRSIGSLPWETPNEPHADARESRVAARE